jgi:hypothetical protein
MYAAVNKCQKYMDTYVHKSCSLSVHHHLINLLITVSSPGFRMKKNMNFLKENSKIKGYAVYNFSTFFLYDKFWMIQSILPIASFNTNTV